MWCGDNDSRSQTISGCDGMWITRAWTFWLARFQAVHHSLPVDQPCLHFQHPAGWAPGDCRASVDCRLSRRRRSGWVYCWRPGLLDDVLTQRKPMATFSFSSKQHSSVLVWRKSKNTTPGSKIASELIQTITNRNTESEKRMKIWANWTAYLLTQHKKARVMTDGQMRRKRTCTPTK